MKVIQYLCWQDSHFVLSPSELMSNNSRAVVMRNSRASISPRILIATRRKWEWNLEADAHQLPLDSQLQSIQFLYGEWWTRQAFFTNACILYCARNFIQNMKPTHNLKPFNDLLLVEAEKVLHGCSTFMKPRLYAKLQSTISAKRDEKSLKCKCTPLNLSWMCTPTVCRTSE